MLFQCTLKRLKNKKQKGEKQGKTYKRSYLALGKKKKTGERDATRIFLGIHSTRAL